MLMNFSFSLWLRFLMRFKRLTGALNYWDLLRILKKTLIMINTLRNRMTKTKMPLMIKNVKPISKERILKISFQMIYYSHYSLSQMKRVTKYLKICESRRNPFPQSKVFPCSNLLKHQKKFILTLFLIKITIYLLNKLRPQYRIKGHKEIIYILCLTKAKWILK